MNFSFSRSWPQILHTVHPQFSIWPHWFTLWILRQTIGLFIPFTTGKENYMHWIFIFTKKINYSNFLSDFKDITASTNSTSGGTGNVPLPNILLGVTNPFFGKALKHWPHIVKLGDHNTLNGLLKSPSKSNNGVAEKQKGMSKFKLDSKPGLYSSSKTLLDKDKGKNKKNPSNYNWPPFQFSISRRLKTFVKLISRKNKEIILHFFLKPW